MEGGDCNSHVQCNTNITFAGPACTDPITKSLNQDCGTAAGSQECETNVTCLG